MSDAGSVVQPIAKSRLGRQTASANIYHPSKSQLIDWVNQILLLGITRVEEFASGAVYCQTFDAFYENSVPIYRVNFHAKEEYEFIPNYKILQSLFSEKKINRDMNVQKLMRGSPSDTLEFLQWMYKFLKKEKIIANYDPFERRLRSYKGGTDRIPMPYWMHSHFDVYGKPEGSTHRHTESLFDPRASPGSKSRQSRTPGPFGSGSSRSSRHVPQTRTTSADARNYPAEVNAFGKEPQGSRRTPQDSMELHISKGKIKSRELRTSKSPLTPMDRRSRRHATPPAVPSIGSPRGSIKSAGDSSSVAFSVKIRAVENHSSTELPTAPLTPTAGGSSNNNAEEAVIAVRKCLDTLNTSIPNFDLLMEDLGTDSDTYAYRGKLRGMKDVIMILIRHNSLLVEELEKIQKMLEPTSDDLKHSFRGFPGCVKQIGELENEFDTSVHRLTELETRNPIPRNCSLTMTDRQNALSDTTYIDNTLRRIGAAQANLHHPTINLDTNRSYRSQAITPTLEGVRSWPDPAAPVDTSQHGSMEETLPMKTQTPAMMKDGEYQIRKLKNGDIYKGRYTLGKKNGEGVYFFAVGDTYEGNFIEDRMEGLGVYTFAVEGRYEGEWKDSLYDGVGTESFARGSTYHGEYNNGMRHGWGACRYFGGAYYEGEWKNGLREGRGMQQCTDDSNFIGDYLAGKRHGYGVYCFPNGDRYVGEYERDIPHGYGVYTFTTGQKYEGQWKQGKKQGWCVYTIETGEIWAGEWSDGKPAWIQACTNGDEPDPRWPDEVCQKVESAWSACKTAREADLEGSSRAEEHWKADGAIQRSIIKVRALAEKAVINAHEERKKAAAIAERLDKLAAEQSRAES